MKAVAHSPPKLRARTAKTAREAVARIGIIAAGVAAHDGLALLVSARALSTCALEAIATPLSVWCSHVGGASRSVARAGLLGITLASAGTADSACRGKLALTAAVLVGIVADCTGLELAGRSIATRIVAAAFCATTVALFAFFDNAIAALLSTDGGDALVCAETLCVDAVPSHGSTDVADTARGKVGNTLGGGRVHDIFLASITGAGAERAALLRGDSAVRASLRCAIMHGAERVASFVTVWDPLVSTFLNEYDERR